MKMKSPNNGFSTMNDSQHQWSSLSIDEFPFHQNNLIPGHQPLVSLLYVAGWTIVWLSNLQVVFTIIIFIIVITTSSSKSFHPDVSCECDIYLFSGLNEEQVKIVSVTSRQEEVCSHSSFSDSHILKFLK